MAAVDSARPAASPIRTVRSVLGRLAWPLLALGAVYLYNALFSPGFFELEVRDGRLYGSLIDIVNRAAPVMLASLGMTLVLATGGVDLSVGAVMAISGAVAALVIRGAGSPYAASSFPATLSAIAPALGLALGASLLAGWWNGFLVAFLDIQPIVATLILMVAGRGIAQLLTGGQILTVQSPPFEAIGGGFLFGLPLPISITLLVALALGFAARATAFGLFVEAAGGNAIASRYAGAPVRKVTQIAYMVSGACSGLAGVIVASDIKAADANNAGMYLELDAILAAVIGGTSLSGGRFNLAGALVGAILIQSLSTTILTKGIPVQFTLVVKSLVVVGVCLLQSEPLRRALAGRRNRR